MKRALSSLSLRIISSIILIPMVIGIMIWGGWGYGILLAACIGAAVSEWINLTLKITPNLFKRIIIGLIGLIYLEFSFVEMAYLRLWLPNGFEWILFLFLTIWSSDTLAFIMGKNIGGRKMTPTISPNKTWSGYVGALLGPAFTLSICIHILTPTSLIENTPSLISTIIAGALMGMVGQSGDLLISLMKRKAGVKDTGHLIPGHGGILDRIDALLLVIPVYCAYLVYIHPDF
ncbi:MAG: phosphatidate cytidylyltransferase [Alphaproteobacteria bacterium]|nr:phosphatidate cytidylyltransferase [Alphaproteobacteria bacterium]MCB1551800.1 phosphatidate cytidylyltransferase [Alphaproteobacteria bacterium]MCB9984977.1 phosphatidate cytidylyltransferase [Micavibrio sp.]